MAAFECCHTYVVLECQKCYGYIGCQKCTHIRGNVLLCFMNFLTRIANKFVDKLFVKFSKDEAIEMAV